MGNKGQGQGSGFNTWCNMGNCLFDSRFHRLSAMAMLLLLTACASTTPLPPPAADHHVHLRSEIAARALPRVQAARGERPADLSGGRQDAEMLLSHLDRLGIEQAAILSLGYMYAIPDISFIGEYDKVRHENDYAAAQAARYPDRLVAFCGISPIAEYALDEIDRCAGMGVTGIKLHMANSDIDLGDDEHMEALAAVFAHAGNHGLAIVIHLRPRGRIYDPDHVLNFINRVLPKAGDVPVQLAHLGGGGGADLTTLAAMRVFAAHSGAYDNLWFDLSGVFLRTEDIPGASRTDNRLRQNRRAAADLIRLIGPERVLFGSDWDSLEHEQTLQPLLRLGYLTEEEIRAVLSNKAPWLPD